MRNGEWYENKKKEYLMHCHSKMASGANRALTQAPLFGAHPFLLLCCVLPYEQGWASTSFHTIHHYKQINKRNTQFQHFHLQQMKCTILSWSDYYHQNISTLVQQNRIAESKRSEGTIVFGVNQNSPQF